MIKPIILTSIAALFLATGMAHATDTTIMLVCNGSTLNYDGVMRYKDGSRPPSEPMSDTSVAVNLQNKTIAFGWSPNFFLPITNIGETSISFDGGPQLLKGYLNRVTGYVSAWTLPSLGTQFQNKGSWVLHELKCKPTQRMF